MYIAHTYAYAIKKKRYFEQTYCTITILFCSSRILRLISGVLRSPGLCATDPGQRPVLVPSCDHVIVRHRTKSGDNLQRRRRLKNRQFLLRAREGHGAVRGRGRGDQGRVDRRRVGRRGQGKARWHPRRKEVRWLVALNCILLFCSSLQLFP